MTIVCIGDSLTHGYKVKQRENWPSLVSQALNIEVVNQGINGDTTGGMLARFNADVIGFKPSHVMIMGGENDLIWGVPITVVEANLAAMVQQAAQRSIIPMLGVPLPIAISKAQKYWSFVNNFPEVNKSLEEIRTWIISFAKNFSVTVVDFYPCFVDGQNAVLPDLYCDGLHPTPTGNKLMSDVVLKTLKLTVLNESSE
ncbi:GDSL-type esterase/lipase family protein [Desulfosporosinus metallidurans]|uniref:Arylesterase n=1 Tax=Desulfosporosinus metallidurans TaxID=1888891 RepID=A0A1Q8QZC8_9FIRM|nr:GDSL-type esterase/lipase family protein [Desulfosporosinus metallidurans]OLN32722.1 Arylesterase precursor [Desulfosporosinus metallidurans]